MIGDTLSSRSADTLSLLRQNQTSPAKADTDSLQLVDLHAVQEVDSGFEGIGCGGIGFDTAMYLSQPGESTSQNIAGFCNEWGIDSSLQQAGGLSPQGMQIPLSPRQIVMLQRKASKPGQGLGKTTGWIHRTTLLSRGVKMIPGVSYQKIDDDGLHVVINGETQVLAVDNVVICAGQEPNRALAQPLIDSGKTVHLIGGCDVAMELDARRAIAQGTRLALEI